MLSMDYFDRDGDKWSIEKGDWKSHQANSHNLKKKDFPKFKAGGVALLMLVLAAVLAFITMK